MYIKRQELKRPNATVLTHNSSIIMITHYGFFKMPMKKIHLNNNNEISHKYYDPKVSCSLSWCGFFFLTQIGFYPFSSLKINRYEEWARKKNNITFHFHLLDFFPSFISFVIFFFSFLFFILSNQVNMNEIQINDSNY